MLPGRVTEHLCCRYFCFVIAAKIGAEIREEKFVLELLRSVGGIGFCQPINDSVLPCQHH